MSMRRKILSLLLLTAFAPLVAEAQSPAKIPRLCFMTFDPGTLQSNRYASFFQRLSDLGYIDQKTINIDYLTADGHGERFPALAAECLRLHADIIVVSTTPAAQAAKKATSTIPIVLASLGDPVGTGLVDSLAHPGANITGFTYMAPGIAAKRLDLLKQTMPKISRVLVLTYLTDPIAASQVKEMKKAASSMGVMLLIHDIRSPDYLERAFEAGARARAEGLLITAESIFVVNQARVVELAAKYRLPASYPNPSFVEIGGLMSYSQNINVSRTRIAMYVDKILKGAKPADMPIEQPTTFELHVNLKTAKELGLKVPQSVLLRADRVIE